MRYLIMFIVVFITTSLVPKIYCYIYNVKIVFTYNDILNICFGSLLISICLTTFVGLVVSDEYDD